MRTYKTGVAGLFLAGTAAIAMTLGLANISGASAKTVNNKDKVAFTSVDAAYRQGIGAYRAGKISIALPALEYAAKNKKIIALFLLARLHSGHSKGLTAEQRNPRTAFKYYRILAAKLYDTRYRYPHGVARVAADVFIALAEIHRDGLESEKIKPSNEAAVRLYRHAAVNFHDPVAEYHFASAFRSGLGVHKNYKNAFRWFFSSARKNYAPSQAKLGMMYWQGEGLKKADHVRGLALLKVAVYYSNKDDQKWIKESHDKMLSSVGRKTIAKATQLFHVWQEEYGVPAPKKDSKPHLQISENQPARPKLPSSIAPSDKNEEQDPYLRIETLTGKKFMTLPANHKGDKPPQGLQKPE